MELDLFIRNLRWEDLRPETREMTLRCVLDTLGCSLAGVEADNFLALVKGIKKLDAGMESPVWGTEISTSLPWSIFLNSYTTAFFDMDDGHRLAQGHPGAAIIPAALGVADYLGSSGKAFLEAVVVGYEIAVRSARLMREMGGPRKGSGAWVVPGVAAAVSRLMNGQDETILSAIGLAEYFSLQAPQDRSASFPSLMKEGLPWGAYTGYTAAFLASNGMSGMRPYLADSSLLNDLSEWFEIEQVYFKQYACCRWAHPAIDGLKKMFEELGHREEKIDQIFIRTFEKALLLNRRDPSNTMEAVYSIPFAVASYLVHGKLSPQEVSGKALRDERVAELSRRVTLQADSEMTKLFPAKCLQQVEVAFKTGEQYKSGVLSAKGDPADPLTDHDLLAKFKMLTENLLPEKWQKIPKIIEVLEKRDASELVDLLTGRIK
ncbi:MAG: MmgE/PrpD family protein [Deltaproteobacteria bacterium]|nr:MmgE/PrpD family protein [Deltaproteobacteria bacterium]